MKKKIIVLSSLALIIPSLVFASEGYAVDVELMPESLEFGIEIFNMLISITAVVFALQLAKLTKGGHLEKIWNIFAMSAVAFALVEAVGALKGASLVHVGGLKDILELVFVVLFAVGFYKTVKVLSPSQK
ncbi:MAG: hypothetical protein Q8P90_02910 [bacterium]|nr:hypothetical protein [bacterium]